MGYDKRNKRYKKLRDQRSKEPRAEGEKKDSWRDPRGDYVVIEKDNAVFEAYYKAQGTVPEGEWDDFMAALRRLLPTTFRFAGSRSHALDVRDAMVKKFLPTIMNLPPQADGEAMIPPAPIPWYPNELAWNLSVGRTLLRKSPELNALHQFLVSETEAGNISRQEAVSMIPPLLLDVHPGQWVLDMCAAPGSKTAQIAEALEGESSASRGILIANDADYKRAQIMVRQVKRVNTPCLLVTNHEGQLFPSIQVQDSDGSTKPISFDRILCDVPCSGDGTMRKNPLIWRNWSAHQANSLHLVQLRILLRAAQLCRPGGRIVYSTCSMNPVENEAVVAEAIRRSSVPLEIVDVSDQLPELKRNPGLLDWMVMSKDGQMYRTLEDAPKASGLQGSASLFAQPDLASLNIQRCLRVLPHMQDTGAFFIAVLRVGAVASLSAETNGTEQGEDASKRPAEEGGPASSKKGKPDHERPPAKIPGPNDRKWGEDPFIFLPDDDAVIQELRTVYGIADGFPFRQTLTRSPGQRHKTVYLVSDDVRKALQATDVHRLKVVNAGLKLFVRNDSDTNAITPYRIHSEGLPYIFPYLSDNRVIRDVPAQDVLMLLQTDYPMVTALSESTAAKLDAMGQGCVILQSRTRGGDGALLLQEPPLLVVWRAKVSCNLLLNKTDRRSLLVRLGVDVTDEAVMQKKLARTQADGGAENADGAAEADGDAKASEGEQSGEESEPDAGNFVDEQAD
ncbi:S-adenosyl-L-methionine-dependent methyltransferase [Hyaloraphidium curvatum]|nr:S-adenosyl-L-methionine-dependent methyltransferase [Hyaloraphidium curvatum]